jgi:formylmethanofuran dehydrogenase subunit E
MAKQKGKTPMDSLVGGGSWIVRCDRCGEILSKHRTEQEAMRAPQICSKHR